MSEFENKDNETPEKVSPEIQAKADRHIKILYGVMIFFIALPFIVMWLIND